MFDKNCAIFRTLMTISDIEIKEPLFKKKQPKTNRFRIILYECYRLIYLWFNLYSYFYGTGIYFFH